MIFSTSKTNTSIALYDLANGSSNKQYTQPKALHSIISVVLFVQANFIKAYKIHSFHSVGNEFYVVMVWNTPKKRMVWKCWAEKKTRRKVFLMHFLHEANVCCKQSPTLNSISLSHLQLFCLCSLLFVVKYIFTDN